MYFALIEKQFPKSFELICLITQSNLQGRDNFSSLVSLAINFGGELVVGFLLPPLPPSLLTRAQKKQSTWLEVPRSLSFLHNNPFNVRNML